MTVFNKSAIINSQNKIKSKESMLATEKVKQSYEKNILGNRM